ncbi:Aspartokinase [Salix suchowensis]|nr:Aspartokinase [Salix suchowensis]
MIENLDRRPPISPKSQISKFKPVRPSSLVFILRSALKYRYAQSAAATIVLVDVTGHVRKLPVQTTSSIVSHLVRAQSTRHHQSPIAQRRSPHPICIPDLHLSHLPSPSFIDTVDLLRRLRTPHYSKNRRPRSNEMRVAARFYPLPYQVSPCDSACHWLDVSLLFIPLSFSFSCDALKSPRSKDSIGSLGEHLDCKIMMTLRNHGVDAAFVSSMTSSSTTTRGRRVARRARPTFYDRLSVALCEISRRHRILRPAPGSLLQQVTLGHTDPCSALLAVGLEAGELQIWKEVDGIFTADPHKCRRRAVYLYLSYPRRRQRRRYITGVRSCARSRWSMGKKIPICIRNVEKPEGGGTIIHPDSDVDAADALDTASATLAGTRSLSVSSDERHNGSSPLPSRVTIEELIIVLHGNSNRKSASHGFLAGYSAR